MFIGQLTVDDIISEIRDAHCKWEDIGIQLNIGKPDLDAINEEFRDNPQNCLAEMLTLWLRQGKSPTTWCKLISVLKHPTVGFQQLAEEIESKKVHPAEQSMSAVGVQTESPKQETEDGKQLYKCGCKNCPNKVEIESKEVHAAEQSTFAVGVQTESTKQETENGKQLYSSSCETFPNKVEVGCPDPIPVNVTFPRVSEYEGLSDGEREVLKSRLYLESKEIMQSYYDLYSSFFNSLTEREVKVKKLVIHLKMINAFHPVRNNKTPLVQEHSKLLASVTDIEGVMDVIEDYSSFFNYGVLEHMIKHCGSPEDQEKMQKYKDKFVQYSCRRIYECPSDTGCEVKKGHMDMIVKLDANYDTYTLSALEEMKIMIGKLLLIAPETLQIRKLEEGCIMVTFQIPNFVCKATFPLSAEQEKSLLELGVLWLTCGDYHFPKQDNQVYTCIFWIY